MFWFAFLFTEFVLAYEWVTETLLYILPHFLCVGNDVYSFQCDTHLNVRDTHGGKSMWKRKGFENVEMASIHHDEDSPIHNIWSLHGVVVETPTLATHNFQPFVNELPKRSPCTTVPTTTNPSITIILDFISPKSLQPCHTLCPFRWLVYCWVSPSHKIPTDKSH